MRNRIWGFKNKSQWEVREWVVLCSRKWIMERLWVGRSMFERLILTERWSWVLMCSGRGRLRWFTWMRFGGPSAECYYFEWVEGWRRFRFYSWDKLQWLLPAALQNNESNSNYIFLVSWLYPLAVGGTSLWLKLWWL